MNSPRVPQHESPTSVPMRMAQQRAGAKTFFDFGEESLRHGLDDGSASRTWTIEYADLSAEREHFVERSIWWRNIGLIRVGVGTVVVAMAWFADQAFRPSSPRSTCWRRIPRRGRAAASQQLPESPMNTVRPSTEATNAGCRPR